MTRLAIIGTRRNSAAMRDLVTVALRGLDRDIIIVTGDCPTGVDHHVARAAEHVGLVCVVVHARGRDRDALLERNTVIAEIATEGLAFPDAASRGTWDTVRKLQERGKRCPHEMVPA